MRPHLRLATASGRRLPRPAPAFDLQHVQRALFTEAEDLRVALNSGEEPERTDYPALNALMRAAQVRLGSKAMMDDRLRHGPTRENTIARFEFHGMPVRAKLTASRTLRIVEQFTHVVLVPALAFAPCMQWFDGDRTEIEPGPAADAAWAEAS
jgi:hypothetical protein